MNEYEYDYDHTNVGPVYTPQPKPDMTVVDWIITLILTAIPVVNVICLIVWAVSSSPYKRSRKNWAIAQILMFIIFIILLIVLVHFGHTAYLFESVSPSFPSSGGASI